MQVRGAAVLLNLMLAPAALQQVAQSLYALSKAESNDTLFLEAGLLPRMLKLIRRAADPARGLPPNAAVLLAGAIKNSTISSRVRAAVIAADGAMLIGWLLRSPALGSADTSTLIAVQASGVLRNLAASSAHTPLLLAADSLRSICGLLAMRAAQPDVALNVARIMSKLSTQPTAQSAIMANGGLLRALLRTTRLHARDDKMRAATLRFAFAFGNLTAADAANSATLAAIPGAVDTALDLLVASAMLLRDAPASAAARGSASLDEAATHAVRWVANLATHEDAGKPIARDSRVAAAVTAIFGCRTAESSEELLLHSAHLVSNVSFYTALFSVEAWDEQEGGGNVLLALPPDAVLRPLVPLLVGDNDDGVAQALRTLGNFCRVPSARDFVRDSRADEALVLLMGSKSAETLRAVAGVLVNVTCTAQASARLAEIGVGRALAGALLSVLPAATEAYSRPSEEEEEAQCKSGSQCDASSAEAPLIQRTAVVLVQLLVNMLSFHTGSETAPLDYPPESSEPRRPGTPPDDAYRQGMAAPAAAFEFGGDFWGLADAIVGSLQNAQDHGAWRKDDAALLCQAEAALLRFAPTDVTEDAPRDLETMPEP